MGYFVAGAGFRVGCSAGYEYDQSFAGFGGGRAGSSPGRFCGAEGGLGDADLVGDCFVRVDQGFGVWECGLAEGSFDLFFEHLFEKGFEARETDFLGGGGWFLFGWE